VRFRAACAAALVLAAFAPAVRADMTKKQCAATNAEGQALRLDGKLGASRVQFEMCGDPHCPAMVRDDCAQRLEEIERTQPTILFEMSDAAGASVSAVKIAVDGRAVADGLIGTAMRVDPGEHTFTFTTAGGAEVTKTFVLKEGEKNRRERIVVGRETGTPPGAPASAPLEKAPRAEEPVHVADRTTMSGQRMAGLVAGGAGIVAVAVGSVLGAMTFSAVGQAKSDCESSSSCSSHALAVSEHGVAETYGAASTAAFIWGGVLVAVGAVLFFVAPRSSATTTTGVRLSPSAPGVTLTPRGLALRF
jgi:hypothetical protein